MKKHYLLVAFLTFGCAAGYGPDIKDSEFILQYEPQTGKQWDKCGPDVGGCHTGNGNLCYDATCTFQCDSDVNKKKCATLGGQCNYDDSGFLLCFPK